MTDEEIEQMIERNSLRKTEEVRQLLRDAEARRARERYEYAIDKYTIAVWFGTWADRIKWMDACDTALREWQAAEGKEPK